MKREVYDKATNLYKELNELKQSHKNLDSENVIRVVFERTDGDVNETFGENKDKELFNVLHGLALEMLREQISKLEKEIESL